MSNKWNIRFMDLANHIASWSKDTSTKVGAVIVGPNNEIRSTGFNGLPRGVWEDEHPNRHIKPLKYLFTEHAERNAIYHAARMGSSVDGCTIYISSLPPCADCARAIIQAGITEVIYANKDIPKRWKKSCNVGLTMLKEARVRTQAI